MDATKGAEYDKKISQNIRHIRAKKKTSILFGNTLYAGLRGTVHLLPLISSHTKKKAPVSLFYHEHAAKKKQTQKRVTTKKIKTLHIITSCINS